MLSLLDKLIFVTWRNVDLSMYFCARKLIDCVFKEICDACNVCKIQLILFSFVNSTFSRHLCYNFVL